ncbi:MAG: class I SAM-dependent methyltransferase [Proteobacteria bacterium]|nr:class I SAM-dependent methyltransferase [Pseudomonadota bacterium]
MAVAKEQSGVDPVVSYLIGATNGIAYKRLRGCLEAYPIPTIRLPKSNGGLLLDVGCSWGRWSIAAAQKGYRVIGIDPSLGAVMAARRVAHQLGVDVDVVVGDARFLPFLSNLFDDVFSYSVIQHFSRSDAALAVGEVGRVLKPDGISVIQMPTQYGIRCLQHQIKRGFRDGIGFDVRYWSIPDLKRLFSSKIGLTAFSVDCYFGIGLQYSDIKLMPIWLQVIVAMSELVRYLSLIFRPLVWLADSVYVRSVKRP